MMPMSVLILNHPRAFIYRNHTSFNEVMLYNNAVQFKGAIILSSNAFDPRELNKGSIVKSVSKPGGEKLLKMRHCFHLFLLQILFFSLSA